MLAPIRASFVVLPSHTLCHPEQREGPGVCLPRRQSWRRQEPRSLPSLGMTVRFCNSPLLRESVFTERPPGRPVSPSALETSCHRERDSRCDSALLDFLRAPEPSAPPAIPRDADERPHAPVGSSDSPA